MNDLSANFSDAAPLDEGRVWTDARKEDVKMMLKIGITPAAIAAKLGHGISRNAVIGIIHRMGLSKRAAVPYAPREPRPSRAKAEAAKPAVTLVTKPAVTARPLPCAPVALPPAPQGPGISLVALTSTACHWPLNDGGPYLFCGAPKDGVGPYCEYHARIAYQPLPVRKPDGAARFRVGPARAAVR